MCGIAGFSGRGDEGVLRAMLAAIAHRGPDADGVSRFPERNLHLGHKRLSIVDIQQGAQPMQSADGDLCVVFNGEIYNHLALRRELEARGHRFLTDHSDTEVLLHGYRQWGTGLQERLNGMWAFAVYDRDGQQLLLSRDRMGQKPLYYRTDDEGIVFASELRAMGIHPRVPREVDPMARAKLFAYTFIPSPSSYYKEVYKLPAGHGLLYDLEQNRGKPKAYWRFALQPDRGSAVRSQDEYAEEFREVFDRAVQRRLMADVPVGLLVSGGIDSSAVTAFACQHLDRAQTFSVGFEEPSFDESTHAERVSRLYGTRHHTETLRPAWCARQHGGILDALDEPLGDPSFLPTWFVFQMVAREVKVVLSGDGADELFAGYDPFKALFWARALDRVLPVAARRMLHGVARRLPVSHANMSLDFKIQRALLGLQYPRAYWNPVWLGALPPGAIRDFLGVSFSDEEIYAEALESWEECACEDPAGRTLEFFTRLYLEGDILPKVDRASMLHSVECRAPFLDPEVVAFASRLPLEYKFRRGRRKVLLKRAFADVLPAEILQRPKKGFGVPTGRWFQDGTFNATGAGLPPQSRPYLELLQEEHRRGRANHRLFLYNCLVLDHHPAQGAVPPPEEKPTAGSGRSA